MSTALGKTPLSRLLAWIALCLSHSPIFAGDEGDLIFADAFQGRLAEGWFWVREEPDHWRVGPAGLELRVLPGGLWGGGNNARNVLLRNLPSPVTSPVEISVTFTNTPANRWEQSNLAWYYDDGNMVKLGQELVAERLTVVMGREENDRPRTIAIVPLDDFTVGLRLQAVGNRIRGQFRTRHWPGWRDVGECDLPVQGEPKASLHCYNGSPDLEHWSRATGFAIRRLPPESADWPRLRAEEQSASQPAASGRLVLAEGFSLVNRVGEEFATGAQPGSDQVIYRNADGSFGWSWDRRVAGGQPGRPGVEFQPREFPIPLAGLHTFEAELDVVARLNIDRPNHQVVLAVSFSDSPVTGSAPSAQLLLCFDWYGKDWSGPAVRDGHRDYAFDAAASTPARLFYRLQGLRGVPPRVNLKPLLEDALRRTAKEPVHTLVGAVWLGNEVWERSSGSTLVTKLDFHVNRRRFSTTPP